MSKHTRHRHRGNADTASNDSERATSVMAEAHQRLSAQLGVVPNWCDLLQTPNVLIVRLDELAAEWSQALASLDQERETKRWLASKCDSAAFLDPLPDLKPGRLAVTQAAIGPDPRRWRHHCHRLCGRG